MRELLVSHDGQYLFICILYLDIEWEEGSYKNCEIYSVWVYDLQAKKLVNHWQTDASFYRDSHIKVIRALMIHYPECILNNWNFSRLR